MSLYDDITNQIIKALEDGIVPWHCPFKKCSLPTNFKTGQAYNGMNTLMLWLGNLKHGYTSHYWLGFGQAKQLNGNVKKGEKATRIIAGITKKKETKDEGNDMENVITHFLGLNTFFNLDQIEGIKIDTENEKIISIDSIEDLIKNAKVTLKHQGERTFYKPSQDYINMPLKSKFEDTEGYYSTLLHELIHWTGHKNRLNRLEINKESDRAFEELVAEIGSVFFVLNLVLHRTLPIQAVM